MNNCPDCMTNENAVGEGIRCAAHEIDYLHKQIEEYKASANAHRDAQIKAEAALAQSQEKVKALQAERDHEHELYLSAHRENMKAATRLMESKAERDAMERECNEAIHAFERMSIKCAAMTALLRQTVPLLQSIANSSHSKCECGGQHVACAEFLLRIKDAIQDKTHEKITDKIRIKWMLDVGAIGGGWFDPDMQDWPTYWDSEVMRDVVDAAIRGRKGKK